MMQMTEGLSWSNCSTAAAREESAMPFVPAFQRAARRLMIAEASPLL
ncbi:MULTISPECIES: hypothetical protein [unclassified Collinsella]|nr:MULTISPECIES: hypothetical protein [unclassified Collinsella]